MGTLEHPAAHLTLKALEVNLEDDLGGEIQDSATKSGQGGLGMKTDIILTFPLSHIACTF